MFKFLRNLNLALKLNAALIIILGLILFIILFVVTNRTNDLANQTGQQRVQEEAQVIRQRFTEAEAKILATANILASLPELVAAVDSGDADLVKRIALLQRSTLDLDDIDIVDAEGESLTTVTEASVEFDEEEDAKLMTFGLLGIDSTGLNVEDGDVLLAATTPIRNQAGQIVGAVLTSRLLDDAFLADINMQRNDVHIALAYEEEILAHHTIHSGHHAPDAGQAEANDAAGAGEGTALDFNELINNRSAMEQALNGIPVALENTLFSEGEGNVAHAVGYLPLTVGGNTEAAIILQVSMSSLTSFQNQLVNSTTIIIVILSLVGVLAFVLFVRQTVAQPINKLAAAAQEMETGNLTADLPPAGGDEVGLLTTSFGQMASQLQQTLSDLRQREQGLEANAEISRQLSWILDQQELVTAVVHQVQTVFNYYHAHIYLLDKTGDKLVMAGGTGEAGVAMLAGGHTVNVGQGLVGRAAATQTSVLIPNVAQEAGWLPNPLTTRHQS